MKIKITEQNTGSEDRISAKLLITILSVIIIVNLTIAFSYHMLNWISGPGISGVHHVEHRVIMIYHSLSAPAIAIVTLLFLEIFETRRSISILKYKNQNLKKIIKFMVTIGGVCAGIGATFWAYYDGILGFSLHHIFVGGLSIIFFSGILLLYALIPGPEVKESDYFKELPKIGGVNLLSLNALIVIGGVIVFVLFGLTAAIIMLITDEPFFFIEWAYVIFRATPKELFQELASFHMRLTAALFLTGIIILLFKYTKVKGKAAKIGLWLLLPGTVAMTAGYFLMIFMGKAANSILMPARALILFTGVIIAIYGWIEVSKEDLGNDYSSTSRGKKILAVFKNPLRFSMYIPFFIAGLVVVIPGLVIVADLAAYREISNQAVELSFAMGHPHILATLGAIVIFTLVVHNTIPKGIPRDAIGLLITVGSIITFSAAPFYFLRSATDSLAHDFLKSMILVGLFIILTALIIFIILLIHQLLTNREKLAENIIPLVGR